MILGRPTNLWNGLAVALISLVSVTIMQLLPDVDSEVVATLAAATTLFLGSVIAIVANQPPTLNPGDPYTVVTPQPDRPNAEKVANTNMTPIPPQGTST
jgi:hypothetical protein